MAHSMESCTQAARERAPRRIPSAMMCPRHVPRRPASIAVQRRRQRRKTLTRLQIQATVRHLQLYQAHVQSDPPWTAQLEARNATRLRRRRTRQGAGAVPVVECANAGTTTSDNRSTTRATTSRASNEHNFLLRPASRRCQPMHLPFRGLLLHPLPNPNPSRRLIGRRQR